MVSVTDSAASEVTELSTGLEGKGKSLKSRKHLQTLASCDFASHILWDSVTGRCGPSLEHFLKNKLLYCNFAAPPNLGFDFYFCKIESHFIGMAEDAPRGPAPSPNTFLPLTLKPALQSHQVMRHSLSPMPSSTHMYFSTWPLSAHELATKKPDNL